MNNVKNKIEIRKLKSNDIPVIVEIEKNSYPDPWSEKMFERELQIDFSSFFVAVILGEIVGYVCFWNVKNETQLMNITVVEKFRRMGLGSKLIKHAIAQSILLKSNKMYLEVRENNLAAIKFYEKFGFQKIDIRKKYYSNTDNAIIMEKCL